MSEENTTAEVVSAELPETVVDGATPKVEEKPEDETKPKADEKAPDSEKSIKALQRRVDRLTRERYQLRAENDQLRTPQQDKGEGNHDEGNDVEARAHELAQEIASLKEFNARCDEVYEKGMKSGNFKDSMAAFSEEIGGAFDANGKPSTMMLAVLDADEPHKMIMHLGENAEIAAEISKLSPAKQIRRIAQLERDIAEAAKPKPSTAPKPAQPVKAAGVGDAPDPKDTKRWIEYENEKLAARKSGRRF